MAAPNEKSFAVHKYCFCPATRIDSELFDLQGQYLVVDVVGNMICVRRVKGLQGLLTLNDTQGQRIHSRE